MAQCGTPRWNPWCLTVSHARSGSEGRTHAGRSAGSRRSTVPPQERGVGGHGSTSWGTPGEGRGGGWKRGGGLQNRSPAPTDLVLPPDSVRSLEPARP